MIFFIYTKHSTHQSSLVIGLLFYNSQSFIFNVIPKSQNMQSYDF